VGSGIDARLTTLGRLKFNACSYAWDFVGLSYPRYSICTFRFWFFSRLFLQESFMSSPISRKRSDSERSAHPDQTGVRPPHSKKAYPDIAAEDPRRDDPGLTGGPTTESIPGTAHDLPFDSLNRREEQVMAPVPKAGDGGEAILSGRPRETGGERPDNH
jgi:hypothetical protein